MINKARANTRPPDSLPARAIRSAAVQGGGFGRLGPRDLSGVGPIEPLNPLPGRQLRDGLTPGGQVSKCFVSTEIHPYGAGG